MSVSSSTDAPDVATGRLPRVLFVSVNPFSATSNNGKTFASFFEGYPRESLAQLYFHRELPTSDVCDTYFRITDEDLLAAGARPWRVSGERVTAESATSTPIPARTHAALKGSRTVRLLRQLWWAAVPFRDPALVQWLDEVRPEVVFFCGGDASALYPKVEQIVRRHGARLVLYVTDDYVLPVRSHDPALLATRRWTRRVFTRMARRADLVLTIGDAMTRTYEREFGIASVPVMNMVEVPDSRPEAAPPPADRPLRLLYAGSLHSNRWRVLGSLVDACRRLASPGHGARLRVVGPEPAPTERAAVHRPPHGEHGGMLDPAGLEAAIAGSDVLVHVEADDRASMAVTALSVSTKIPEYLASGRTLLAIGPRGIASIDYLAEHDVALIVAPDDAKGLDDALETLRTRPALHEELRDRAFDLARRNHDGARTRRLLWERLRKMTS